MAHKKGMGSTKNGRDSNPKMLGLKRADGQFVTAGSILVRQNGTKIYPGHDYGPTGTDTIGKQKKTNPYFTNDFAKFTQMRKA